VKRLSRYRRHKAVGPSLLIFALLAIGTTFSVASATTTAIVVSYYWHFVDGVWIALFAAIYLIR